MKKKLKTLYLKTVQLILDKLTYLKFLLGILDNIFVITSWCDQNNIKTVKEILGCLDNGADHSLNATHEKEN